MNYYGPQRFGQGQIVQTDQIGLALLNEKMVFLFCNLSTYCQENFILLLQYLALELTFSVNNVIFEINLCAGLIARSVLITT